MITQHKEQLRKLFQRSPVWAIPATVNSIEGNTCTVTFLNSTLTVSGVSIYPDSPQDETGTFSALPAIGSFVTVTALAGKLDELFLGGIMAFTSLSLGKNFQLHKDGSDLYLIHPDGRRVSLIIEQLNQLFL
ncbi:hypothetical protein ACO2Q8_04055 [Larkinella sp. VNQ87]|uniref:hypothetical protein n=1 Tax=Larkinella sp. VNQ87 TaxID=3400921 RepID=UPI003C0C2495